MIYSRSFQEIIISITFLALMMCTSATSVAQLSNQNANAITKQIYTNFIPLGQSCELMWGQNLRHGNEIQDYYGPYITDLQQQTGEALPIVSADYGLGTDWNYQVMHPYLEQHWNQNGLVTLSWHTVNPWTGGDSWDVTNQALIADLINPSKSIYTEWRSMLDEIADALLDLQSRGVTVMWRPLHEANGDWFWWGHPAGAHSNASYQALWIDMYDYFTESKGLNNLIWVYCAAENFSNANSTTFCYPGDNYVDLVSLDIYQDNLSWVSPQDFSNLINTGKPFGISEFGPAIPNAAPNYDYNIINDFLKINYPEVTYIVAWHSWAGHYNALVDNFNATSILSDPCHVNIGHTCPFAGTPCNDGDQNTTNDVADGSCGCVGEISMGNCELISNGNFENANSGWQSLFHTGGAGSANLNDDYAAIDISNGGSEFWSIQLYQENISISAGDSYELYFSVRANQSRSISVELGENGGAYASYYLQTIPATSVWTDHSFIVNPGVIDNEARLLFHLGQSAIDVDLDNISLRRINCDVNTCKNTSIQVDEQNIDYQIELQVSDWIKSSATLLPAADVIFSAAAYVELQAGFEVRQGASFVVMIEACQ